MVEEEEYTIFSAIRTVATFDDALHHQRKEEDSSSPKSVLEVQQAVKRNHSDSNLIQLAASANKGSPWKCNLCFYKNADITKAICAMCGTNKDDSFMEALDALDNLAKGPNKNEQQEQVLQDNEVSFQTMTEKEVSFETAEDGTLASFQTAQQSQGDNTLGAADASTIHAPTAEATDTATTAKQDESALESFRDTARKLSQKLIDISVDSSLTCNTSLNNNNKMDDSLNILLNTTQTNDEDFDPILFTSTQSGDMLEDDMQQHDYGSPPSKSVLVPLGDADHQFSFDEEFRLEHIVGDEKQQQEDVDSQNFVFEKEDSTTRNVWLLRGAIVSFVFLVVLVSALSIR
jgi:hypothetical protein